VALSQVAKISEEEGPIQVIREGTQRYATVLANVRGRDLVPQVCARAARVVERRFRSGCRACIRSWRRFLHHGSMLLHV
jgi:cobalt-zinc-cadmium resistance protein CzcA